MDCPHAAQIIRYMRDKINAFKDRLCLFSVNMDKFCNHVQKTIKCLKSIGGANDQAFDKLYEAPVETNITSFLSQFVSGKL